MISLLRAFISSTYTRAFSGSVTLIAKGAGLGNPVGPSLRNDALTEEASDAISHNTQGATTRS
eukprot:6206418-Pleurochrysis_carterae.AAC.1